MEGLAIMNQVVQLVILVGQVEGNLLKSGHLWLDSIMIATLVVADGS